MRSLHTQEILFQLRLNSLEYQDLRMKLARGFASLYSVSMYSAVLTVAPCAVLQAARVVEAQSVVVRQSLSERFVEAFRQQVASNVTFSPPADMVSECVSVCLSLGSSCAVPLC